MNNFLVIFGMFFAMMTLMGVGILMKRKPISGSCGGLGNVGVEKACDCDKPCENRLEKMSREQAEQRIHFEQL